MKILITGGHLMPALSVIDSFLLQKKAPGIEIIFVGRQYNLDNEKSYSLEYKEIIKRKIKFIPLTTGRFLPEPSIKSLKNFFLIGAGLVNGWKILNQEKPDAILTFGGFLGFPFIVSAWIKKIPTYIHEQTLNPGFVNRLGNYFAKKVFISFPQTKKYFSENKLLVTGNPVRKNIFVIDKKPFSINKIQPVIYITGGSLGSHSLNIHIGNILSKLLDDFIIVHQTGNVKEYDDYNTLKKIKEKLPTEKKKKYYLYEHFLSDEIGYIFNICDFVVGRAGANTFFELIALKKPAILVPLPWSSHQEQQKQAELFARAGLGKIFSQHDESNTLLRLIKDMSKDLEGYRKNFNQLQSLYKQNAAETIVQTILSQ